MRASTAIILLAMAGGIAVLCSLGFWQLDRLAWKEELIAKVKQNLAIGFVPLSQSLESAEKDKDLGIDYRPVKLSGEFIDEKPIYEFTTFKGKSGWNVFAPFQLEMSEASKQKTLIIINRGFILYDKRDEFEYKKPPTGLIEVAGLLRSIPDKQPSAAYDNDVGKRTFYWRDISAMAQVWNKKDVIENNWYVDEGIPNSKFPAGTIPVPGTTLIKFPNSHLQYAFTWFGLAFALLGVGSYFLYSRRTNNG